MHGLSKMRKLRVTIKDDDTGETLMAFAVSPVRKKKRRSAPSKPPAKPKIASKRPAYRWKKGAKVKTHSHRKSSSNGHNPEAALGGLTFTE